MYTPATKFPATLRAFQWATPDGTNPRLAQPISATQTTIELTSPPLDYDGTPLTGEFLFGIAGNGYNETCYAPAASVSGTTITGAVRGVRLTGIDFTTGDADLAVAHDQDSAVYCNVSAIYYQLISNTLTGVIPTGANTFKVGDLTASDVAIQAANDQTLKPTIFFDDSEGRWKLSWGDDAPASGVIDGVGIPVLTTAERDARTWPNSGPIIFNSTVGELQGRNGGSWIDLASGGTFPDASTTVAGKVEIATSAETIAGTDTGGTGAKLVALPSDIAKNTQSAAFIYGTSTTGNDTYVTTLTPAPAAWADLRVFYVMVDTANTGACSVNPNGLGARSIKLPSGSDPATGDIAAGTIIALANDGTNCVLMSRSALVPVTTSTLISRSKSGTVSPNIGAGSGVFDTSLNLDLDLSPLVSTDSVMIWVQAVYRLYSNGASGSNTFGAAQLNYNGLVGGQYSGTYWKDTNAATSALVDPFEPGMNFTNQVAAFDGTSPASSSALTITPTSSGTTTCTMTVNNPAWSGSNLRFNIQIAGNRGTAGTVSFSSQIYMAVTALRIA